MTNGEALGRPLLSVRFTAPPAGAVERVTGAMLDVAAAHQGRSLDQLDLYELALGEVLDAIRGAVSRASIWVAPEVVLRLDHGGPQMGLDDDAAAIVAAAFDSIIARARSVTLRLGPTKELP